MASKYTRVTTRSRRTSREMSARQWEARVAEYQMRVEVFTRCGETAKAIKAQERLDALMAENPYEAS